MSWSAKIDGLKGNSSSKFEYDTDLTFEKVEEICAALKENTSCTEVVLANVGITNPGAILFAQVIEASSTLQKLDIGYNKIDGPGVEALALAIANNSSLEEMKIHRQEKDMGPVFEEKLVALWLTNTTLTRLYATLHSRKFNGDNTRGEVRNKEISRRKATGKDWLDLDPARKEEYLAQQDAARKQAAADESKANAPISEKIASTGGPYSLKELTSEREFWPDDVELSKRETYLSDDEFQTVFGMDKAAFEALPGWKKTKAKQDKKLS